MPAASSAIVDRAGRRIAGRRQPMTIGTLAKFDRTTMTTGRTDNRRRNSPIVSSRLRGAGIRPRRASARVRRQAIAMRTAQKSTPAIQIAPAAGTRTARPRRSAGTAPLMSPIALRRVAGPMMSAPAMAVASGSTTISPRLTHAMRSRSRA